MQKLEKILEEMQSVKEIMLSPTNRDCFGEPCKESDCCACVVNKCMEIVIKHMNDGWVPVEERLPTMEECEKENNEFLVQTDNGKRFSCEYNPLANGYDNPSWCCNVPVIAWRPLPEPYHQERSEGE